VAREESKNLSTAKPEDELSASVRESPDVIVEQIPLAGVRR
jgi:hypothetical protein